MNNIDQHLLTAVLNRESENVLRHICISLLEQGRSSESVLQQFEAILNIRELDEDYEDTLLDVMDVLSGWCASSQSLNINYDYSIHNDA